MKTAMQKLWDLLDDAEQNEIFEVSTQNFKRYIETMYLQLEKEQIIEACKHGANYDKSPFKDAEDYYNKTFKQE